MRTFAVDKFYCGHCPLDPHAQSFSDAASIRTHLYAEHDIPRAKAENGQDYYRGLQAQQVHARRKKEADAEAVRAARVLRQPNYTVEDFLVDAGDEPWAGLEGHA